MVNEIEKFIDEVFDIKTINRYHFKTLYNLTFVFQAKNVFINSYISSASIKPKGIIFKENGEYLFAPLDSSYEIDEIIKEYVKNEVI